MWNDLVHLGVSAPDKIIRTVTVYLALAIILRLAGKRDLAQLNAFDLVVMLLLSNVVQNAIIGPDNSLTGGLLGAVVLIGVNAVIVRVIRANDRVARLLEGSPTTLATDGRWDSAALRREGLRQADVDAALRRQNANNVGDIALLTIEPGGAIVATLKPGQESATSEDIARLEAKLDALLARQGPTAR
ncbi:MAG TPA: YetF domain-containing protein [Marmoricola sp.]|nr:YetF domain-containing protein [Marmoricola sp.]